MRFVSGIAIGTAIGYILGARAGREQYERLTAIAESAISSEQLNQFVDIEKFKAKLGNGMASASEAIRNAAD